MTLGLRKRTFIMLSFFLILINIRNNMMDFSKVLLNI